MSTATITAPKVETLGALALAGPLWAVVALGQAATRDGFDLTRHPLSMLSTGSLGWLQITNFVVAGALAIVGARGIGWATGSKWAPRLVTAYGVGYILAGVFVLDAGDGFPAGTPLGAPATISWHAIAHLLAGTIAFAALTAVLFVLGRFFARRGERGWAWVARSGGAAVILADVASMAGVPAASAVLATGVIYAMLILSGAALKLRGEQAAA
ncbi:DUF998 domain-containing protein [Kribbella italica]|uniref:DUF998 domain-containing protein n=1 Tax=Kribbella italica TaxID=1540520 RepID=A0A7W9J0Y1_9ACTN|nr:DUF998 domain-containing protein [Kribbella italica]MBB5833617.1 hypothetical protein [Kribbella italica]